MIIRCQNGRLLNADHVVEWDTHTEGEGAEQTHTVIAQTVLDTTIEVFEGTSEECEVRKGEIDASLSEHDRMLLHLCEGFAKRDDKLSATINRLIARTA